MGPGLLPVGPFLGSSSGRPVWESAGRRPPRHASLVGMRLSGMRLSRARISYGSASHDMPLSRACMAHKVGFTSPPFFARLSFLGSCAEKTENSNHSSNHDGLRLRFRQLPRIRRTFLLRVGRASVATRRYLLGPAGTCWGLLGPAGAYWGLP
jgi:hypothetical protein